MSANSSLSNMDKQTVTLDCTRNLLKFFKQSRTNTIWVLAQADIEKTEKAPIFLIHEQTQV